MQSLADALVAMAERSLSAAETKSDERSVRHWADGGETNLANLTSLCAFHHGVIHDGKALLGEDQVFRHADGQPMTSALPATSIVNSESKQMPTPSRERLDLGYALACLHYTPGSSRAHVIDPP